MRRWDPWYRSSDDAVVLACSDLPWWLWLADWCSERCLPAIPIPLIGRIVVNRRDPKWRCTLVEWIGSSGHGYLTLDDLWHHLWFELDICNNVYRRRVGEIAVPRASYLDALGAGAERWIVESEPAK